MNFFAPDFVVQLIGAKNVAILELYETHVICAVNKGLV